MTMDSTPRTVRRRALVVASAVGSLLPRIALAQVRYPERPITLIVPFAPRGIADLTARAVAESMAQTLGQPVAVENRPSAGSIVGSKAVAAAKPDGYTLLLMSNSNAVSVSLFKKLPYDTQKDLMPVSTLGFFDLGVFVPAASRFASLTGLLQFARQHPGALKAGTISIGSTQHLAAQLFQSVARVELLTVPYKASGDVVVALRSGQIDLAFEIVGPMVPQVRAGAIRLLAVTGERPNPALPAVPTAQQAGLGGYHVESWNAIAAPAGTPAAVIERLNVAVRQALAAPKLRAVLEPVGVRLQASTPEQASALLASEITRWGDVMRLARIVPQ
ncbi:MAG: tripartite tricarboxylate transporter substrate-binding protein [Pseudomonadota bacterium]|nr:tripartite tricarboxylate transporter substrate-binding protein [Pseudomonadota bacterium]